MDAHRLVEHHALVEERQLERQARAAPGETLGLVFDLAVALVGQLAQLARQVLRRGLVWRDCQLFGTRGDGIKVERLRRHGAQCQDAAAQPCRDPYAGARAAATGRPRGRHGKYCGQAWRGDL
ncbi:hypothetical protein D3C81_1470530 [compost metagenome]